MAYGIDAAAGYVPVFGVDVTITGQSGARVVGYELGGSAEKIRMRDGLGDTKARIWHDMEQSKSLSIDVIITANDESAAATANAPLPATVTNAFNVGVALVLVSTKHPSVAGNWRIDEVSATGSNTNFTTWRLSLVPEI